MRIKEILVIVLVLISNSIFSQQNINSYKYVTVSKKFDFQKTEDQYQLNSLAKFLLNKEGFETLFDVETKPQELINNACLNLIVKINNNSNMLTTKLNVELMNCKNEVVYSGDGRSKLKEYKKAYHEAIRKALEPLKGLNYKFNPELVSTATTKNEVLKEEPANIKEENAVEVAINESVDVVEAVAAAEAVKAVEAVESAEEAVVKPSEAEAKHKTDSLDSEILYAQKTTNGYQLVDNSPKVVYVLQRSSVVDLFILKDKNGIVYKKNGKWLIEYYANNELVLKELNIKF